MPAACDLSSVLVCADLPPQFDSDTAARDVLAIITGMVDAAGERGEQDGDTLGARVRRPAFGDLDIVSRAGP